MRKLLILCILASFFLEMALPERNASAASFSVDANQVYTYEIMKRDIEALAAAYPHLISWKVAGKSEYGRDIYAVSIGKGRANVFVNGSHHAREWMTTTVNMKMIEQYAKAYYSNTSINGLPARSILDQSTIWFIPMVNPDGVTLQQTGIKAIPASDQAAVLQMNGGSTDFRRWKANAKGVDLNRQYDAKWSSIYGSPGKPAYENFKGRSPASAAEVKTVLSFVKSIDPEFSLSYHSSGQILFWNFYQTGARYTRDHNYAKQLGKMTGYRLVYPGPNPSGGGYTDWFIMSYKRPAVTLEISPYAGETHVPLKNFNSIWEQNKDVGLYAAREGAKLFQQRGGISYDQLLAQVNASLQSSQLLKPYYSTNVISGASLYVSSTFQKRYDRAGSDIAQAQKLASSLPDSHQQKALQSIDGAKEIRLKAAYFIDAVKVGDVLKKERQNLQELVNRGQLDDETSKEYSELAAQLKKEDAVIGRVYAKNVRDLFRETYLLPAKILKETVIYEISRYHLLKEIKELKANNTDPSVIEQKFQVYDRLKERSSKIKEAGNKLYPGKYPALPGFENTLKNIEAELR